MKSSLPYLTSKLFWYKNSIKNLKVNIKHDVSDFNENYTDFFNYMIMIEMII